MKILILKGTKKEIMKMQEEMIERYGNITIKELLDKFNKEVVVLC